MVGNVFIFPRPTSNIPLGGFFMSKYIDRGGCLESAELMADCFQWDKTKQGEKYWESVYDNLIELAGEEGIFDD
jgi:hypothetical protein